MRLARVASGRHPARVEIQRKACNMDNQQVHRLGGTYAPASTNTGVDHLLKVFCQGSAPFSSLMQGEERRCHTRANRQKWLGREPGPRTTPLPLSSFPFFFSFFWYLPLCLKWWHGLISEVQEGAQEMLSAGQAPQLSDGGRMAPITTFCCAQRFTCSQRFTESQR